MLAAYLEQTRLLLQIPSAPTSLYTDANLTLFINLARGQVAGEGECIRKLGTISTVVDQRPYDFADIDLGDVALNGIEGVINVRRINYTVGAGQRQLYTRGWEWFDLYYMNNPVPASSYPQRWAQYGQGASPGETGSESGGSFYLDPPPDAVYELLPDCVCYPAALEDDTTVEALPFMWTYAVPYFAAYSALMSAQTNARTADAERMFNLYTFFMNRARQFTNPSLLRGQYSQAVDPAQINKLGLRPPSAPAAGGGQ